MNEWVDESNLFCRHDQTSRLQLWILMYLKEIQIILSNQNDSYEITINGFQFRKINKIINVIFCLCYGTTSSALRPKLGCSPSLVLDEIRIFLGKPGLNNKDSWPKLMQR